MRPSTLLRSVPCVPPPCVPPPIVRAPLMGSTDGLAAGPGEVGEFISGTASITWNIPANTPNTGAQYCLPLTVPPGDWDVQASLNTEELAITGIDFLVPGLSPPVCTPPLVGSLFVTCSSGWVSLSGFLQLTARSRLLIAAPTDLNFAVEIENATTVAAVGHTLITVTARRMR